MSRQTRRLAALCAWVVSVAVAQDPSGAARRLNNQAAALSAQGEFDAAERLFRAALALCAHDDLMTADVASNLGALCKRLNRYPEAEQLYRRALDLRRQRLPSLRPEIADSMNNLAEVYRLEGRYWEARNLAEAAAHALQRADPGSPNMPILLTNWAGLERDLQHHDRAEQVLQQARRLAEKSGDSGRNSLALVMNTLALVRADQRDYRTAEQLYRQAGSIFERAGPDRSYELAVCLTNLGRTQALSGQQEQGRQSELRALALLNREPHPDELLRAAILHIIGNIEAAEGNVAEALPYFQQALGVQEGILGPGHPSLASVLFDYAAVAGRAGEKSQARKLKKRAEQLMARLQHDDLSRQTVDASAFIHAPVR